MPQSLQNEARIGELGGAKTSRAAASNIGQAISILEDKDARLDGVIRTYVKNNEDLKRLRDDVADGEPITVDDIVGKVPATVAKAAATKAVKVVLEQAGKKAIAESIGPIGWVGTALEWGGIYAIHQLDAGKIDAMLKEDQARITDIVRLQSLLRQQRNKLLEDRAEVERLGKEQARILDRIATLREQLNRLMGKAADKAVTKRETDAAGDEALGKEQLKDAVRLCDPATRKSPQKVGPAGSIPEPLTLGIEAVEETVCRQLEGAWHMDWQNPKLLDASFEIAYDGPADGGGVYTWATPAGVTFRCTAENGLLECLSHQPPPEQCPGFAMPDWQKHWEMAIADDGVTLKGFWRPELSIEVKDGGCSIKPFPLRIEFPFVLLPESGVPEEGDVSAK